MINETFDGDFSISYGLLWKIIKREHHISFQQDIPNESCCCEYCENIIFLLKGIKKAAIDHSSSLKESMMEIESGNLLKKIVCSIENEKCIDGICEGCPGIAGIQEIMDDIDSISELCFFKWISGDKYPEKKDFFVSGKEVAAELKNQLQIYRRHTFNNRRQHMALRLMKENLPADSAVMQVDFSENYENMQKRSIQSAYFGHQNFSIYTACVWYAVDETLQCKSFCVVSDQLEHTKYVAHKANCLIIELIRGFVPKLDHLHIWSDGCAQQFKSRFCTFLLKDYPSDLMLSWNFFASHHGKGPVDGVGGRLKTTVYRNVHAGKVVFFIWINLMCPISILRMQQAYLV